MPKRRSTLRMSGVGIQTNGEVPGIGERSRAQGKVSQFSFSAASKLPVPPSSLWDQYEDFRKDANVALAIEAAKSPIRSASYSFEVNDDLKNDDALQFVQGEMNHIHSSVISFALQAVFVGYSPCEIVYEPKDNGRYIGIDRVKQLNRANTELLTDNATGRLVGLRNFELNFLFPKCFIYSYDVCNDDWYGRGRFENMREAIRNTQTADMRSRDYMDKVCPVIPVVQYPQGESVDMTGTLVDNADIAAGVIRNLCSSRGVTMPNTLFKTLQAMIEKGLTINEEMMRPWAIDILQTSAAHGGEIVELKNMHTRDIYRGAYVPERVTTEGVHGTKAESGEHANIFRLIADWTLQDIYSCFQVQLIDPLIRLNFGAELVGKLRIKPASLVDDTRTLVLDILKELFGKNYTAFLGSLDVDAMVDLAGLPKLGEVIDQASLSKLNVGDE